MLVTIRLLLILIVIVCIQSDEVWLANAQKLLDMTGDIPLGLYETPVPKVR